MTVYHPCSSCRMGSDDAAVLDPQLRLRGVDGLRRLSAPGCQPACRLASLSVRGTMV